MYVHIFPNGKRYFGITCKSPSKRWENGAGYKKKNNDSAVYNAILKYGWDNIQHIILFEELTHEDACAKEIELIAKYKTNIRRYGNDYGYNMTDGGEGTPGHKTPEICKEIGRKFFSERKGARHYKAKGLICDDKEWATETEFCKENNITHGALEKWLDGRNAMPAYWYDKHLHYKNSAFDSKTIKKQIRPFKFKIKYQDKLFNSQKEFADYIKVAPSMLCKWIKKNKIPKYLLDNGFERIQE